MYLGLLRPRPHAFVYVLKTQLFSFSKRIVSTRIVFEWFLPAHTNTLYRFENAKKPNCACALTERRSMVSCLQFRIKNLVLQFKIPEASKNQSKAKGKAKADVVVIKTFRFQASTCTRIRHGIVFRKSTIWRAFSKSCVFGHRFHCIRIRIAVSVTKESCFQMKTHTCARGLTEYNDFTWKCNQLAKFPSFSF